MNTTNYAAAIMLCAAAIPATQAAQKRPNVILILTDDKGYGDLGCYGSTTNQTPNMDRLAAEGVHMTDFHTNGTLSSPTRAALMTGGYQQWTGIEGVVTAADHRDVGLALSEVTIAEVMRDNGYKTAMFGKWHLGYPAEFNPIHQGFDIFKGYVSGNVDYFSHIDQEGYIDWWFNDKLRADEGYTTDLITRYAMNYIKSESKSDDPYFMYLPYEACHSPLQGPNDEAIRSIVDGKMVTKKRGQVDGKAIYKTMVESLDQNIGELLKVLEDSGEADNTIIILFSDNGGSSSSSCAPFSGHKGSLLEGGHRVFSIVHYPKEIKAGTVCDQTIMSMDMMPTICEAVNIPTKGIGRDGISVWKTLTKGKELPQRDLFWKRPEKGVAVRRGDWKLTLKEDRKSGTLINIVDDITEKNNVWGNHPEIVAELTTAIMDWEAQFTNIKSISK